MATLICLQPVPRVHMSLPTCVPARGRGQHRVMCGLVDFLFGGRPSMSHSEGLGRAGWAQGRRPPAGP